MRYAAVTSTGNVRADNQDSLLIGDTAIVGADRVELVGGLASTREGTLVAVVDGMGGHRGGREASGTIVRHLQSRTSLYPVGASRSDGHADAVLEMLTGCNTVLHEEMERRPDLRAMGATIAGLACLSEATVAFNVGDARAYVVQGDGYLRRVSDDHRAPSGLLTQSLGGTVERADLVPTTHVLPVEPGTRWLLCSDGLSDFVPLDGLQEVARGEADVADAVRRLLRAALAAGSTDNVTIVVIDV